MRNLRVYLFFILCFSFIIPAFSQNKIRSILDNSVLKIVVQFSEKSQSMGTGFFIENDSTIVTAAHVFWSAEQLINKKRSGIVRALKYSKNNKSKAFSVPLKLLKINNKFDLAFFSYISN